MKRYTAHVASLIILALFLPLLSCSSGGGGDSGGSGGIAPPPGGAYQWTYMVYMGADNNLSDAGLADLNEMEMVGSSANVAIVVQAEFSTKYSQGMTSSGTSRIFVQNDNDTNSVDLNGASLGNVDMASPAALTDFINWAKTNVPAQHYALVIWDHGAGWKAKKFFSPAKGAVLDETSGNFMSLPDLAKGVADSGVYFDVINFDACLMAMYEVAYEFKGLTDYMVFSEQTEPGEGDPYDTILGALAATPSMSSRDLANTIVNKYDEFYTSNSRGSTTKSAVDMSGLATLDTKLLALGAALTSDSAGQAVMTTVRTTRLEYAYPANQDIGDMCDYLATSAAGNPVKTAAAEVKTALTSMVIDNKTNGSDMEKSSGLSIYLPLASETSTGELSNYDRLTCNKTARVSATGTWGSYLETLISGAGGATAVYKPGNFGIKITWTDPSGAVCDADVDLYVWEPAVDFSITANGDYYAPYMGQTSPNGFFSADSADSGKSEEYYLANEQVLVGYYYFLANLYPTTGTSCNQARVHLFLYDPATFGDSDWHEATQANLAGIGVTTVNPSPHDLDFTNASDPYYYPPLANMNNYSDWWLPFYVDIKTASIIPDYLSGSNLLQFNKKSRLIVRYKKGSRLF